MPVVTKTREERQAARKEAKKAAKKAKKAKAAKKKAAKAAGARPITKAELKNGPKAETVAEQRPMPTAKTKTNSYDPATKILEDRMIPFTFAFAVWYHELPKIRGERNINDGRAANMTALMRERKWSEGHGEISVAQFPDGTIYRLNGQHRCWARFEFGDNDFQPMIRFVKYAVQDMDEYRDLYILFDNPNTDGNRSPAHLIKIALYGTVEYEGVNSTTCNKVSQGYKNWMYGFNNASRKVTIAQLCKELRHEYNSRGRAAAAIVGQIAASSLLKHLNRAPVFAAIFETLKYPTHASEFWQSVIDGLFVKRTDGTKVLSDYLHRTGLGNRQRNKEVTNLVAPDEMYNVCIKCFNASATGKALTKTPPGSGPKAVAKI